MLLSIKASAKCIIVTVNWQFQRCGCDILSFGGDTLHYGCDINSQKMFLFVIYLTIYIWSNLCRKCLNTQSVYAWVFYFKKGNKCVMDVTKLFLRD